MRPTTGLVSFIGAELRASVGMTLGHALGIPGTYLVAAIARLP
jgi:hypothetical protein